MVALGLVLALVAAACAGSGVSQEEFDAELERADQAESMLAATQSELDAATERLGVARDDLANALDNAVEAQQRATALEGEVNALAGNLDGALAEQERLSASLEQAAAAPRPEVVVVGDNDVLRRVQARGRLRCGVSGRLTGFSVRGADGQMQGFDAEFCRAVAVAVLGRSDAVDFVELNAAERFAAVAGGDVDVLFRNTTHTLTRDAELGVDFGAVTYYDGQQLMAPAGAEFSAASTLDDVDGARVCVANEAVAAKLDAALAPGIAFVPVLVSDPNEGVDRLGSACDLVSTDGTSLHAMSIERGGDFVIFPTTPFTREPLAAVVPEGATRWREVVDWVVHTTVLAAEQDVSSTSLDATLEVALLFDFERSQALRLRPDALRDVIRLVGNYDEIFARTLGASGVEQDGLNRVWTEGGLLYAPRP